MLSSVELLNVDEIKFFFCYIFVIAKFAVAKCNELKLIISYYLFQTERAHQEQVQVERKVEKVFLTIALTEHQNHPSQERYNLKFPTCHVVEKISF